MPVSAKVALGSSDFSSGVELEKVDSKALTLLEKSLSYQLAVLGNSNVPEGNALNTGSSGGKVFQKESFEAPSGKIYNFYGQKIDLDLKFKTPNGKITTNREWMKKGNNPYVLNEKGFPVTTNQHHSQQRASGPIFEIKTTTHKNPNNQQVLHPYDKQGLGKYSTDPVDHKVWKKDKSFINKERVKRLEDNE
jgi:hypothetical protein